MNKFDGVANTLFVPLVARINISKKFPEYFMDEKALELEKYLPQGVDKGSSEYSNMASVARYYNMDKTVTAFAKKDIKKPPNVSCTTMEDRYGKESVNCFLTPVLPGSSGEG